MDHTVRHRRTIETLNPLASLHPLASHVKHAINTFTSTPSMTKKLTKIALYQLRIAFHRCLSSFVLLSECPGNRQGDTLHAHARRTLSDGMYDGSAISLILSGLMKLRG